jgi:hypothetical protein
VKYAYDPASDVSNFTDRSLTAICRDSDKFIAWPEEEERDLIKLRIQDVFDIPGCLGFIDGCHINLANAPAKENKGDAAYWSYKKRYGMLLLAVCDHRKRLTFVHWGFSARSSDMRAQQDSRLHRHPEELFRPGEWVLGDSGLTLTEHVIPMFRRRGRDSELTVREVSKFCAQTSFEVLWLSYQSLISRPSSIRTLQWLE